MTKTIPIEKLNNVTKIITHGHCADGMASAILLFDAFLRPNVEPIRFLRPGSEEHAALQPEPGMLLCDIAPHPSRATEFAESDAIVLDHHKHSKAAVEACPYGIFADEDDEPGVSGALLAFRHVWDVLWDKDTHRSKEYRARALDFATLVGISDTGKRDNRRWRQARALAAVLHFYPADSWLSPHAYCVFGHPWWPERVALGETLLAQQERLVHSDYRSAFRFTSRRGTRVLVVNSLTTLTDMQEVEPGAGLVVGFHYTVDGGKTTLAVSMRSSGSFDCGALAVHRGGGGHTRAAGFQHHLHGPGTGPYAFVRSVVEEYEASTPVAVVPPNGEAGGSKSC